MFSITSLLLWSAQISTMENLNQQLASKRWEWSIFAATIVCFLLVIFILKTRKKSMANERRGLKNVPWVSGCLPIVGHGLAIVDTVGFLQRCYDKYGKMFKISIFGVKFVVVADRCLAKEILKQKNAIFQWRFTPIITKSIVLKMDIVLPKMHEEAKALIRNLQGKTGVDKYTSLKRDVMRYVANTSSRCFVGIPLTEGMFDDLDKYVDVLNKALKWGHIFPEWAISFFVQNKLNLLATRIRSCCFDEINKYREDKKKSDSLLLRYAVDTKHLITGEPLTNEIIGDIIILLLYISSENTTLGFINTILDLGNHPDKWNKAKLEAKSLVATNDLKCIINSKYLHSCIMETARLNTHAFSLQRKPKNTTELGDYYIGDADCLSVGSILLHTHGSAEEVFSCSTAYNPDRFIRDKESSGSVVSWGSGVHTCPGKVFAQYEIKMALAFFLSNLKLDMENTSIGSKNFLSPAAFSERDFYTRVLVAE